MIEIKNLTKKFNDDFDAICNLTHNFNAGVTAVVGSDMSGKTTLLNIIAGLDKEYSGEVLIGGEDRKQVQNQNLKISYVTETPTLFERKTVYENLRYAIKVDNPKTSEQDIQNQIKAVSEELVLFGILNKKVKRCNLFEKRLVCLARAVLKKSQILLVDEPFKNLLNFEIASLWRTLLSLTSKLSSTTIIAENTQNLGYFDGVEVLKLDFGVKISG